MLSTNKIYIFFLFISIASGSTAQTIVADSAGYKTIIADASLQKRTAFYQWLWGRNRRQEWAAPVRVPLLWLDTACGGLRVYEAGGGNESKSLHLRNLAGKEYALHSVTKSRNDVVPADFKNTFVEDLVKDGVSSSHPYGAFPITLMQEKAGILHAIPSLVYMPAQPALDSFNARYGNGFYLFEQRPDGDWSEAGNFGNLENFSSTEKVIKKLQEDNKNRADQHAFIKARLFDMLISDWDKHEGNWRWGKSSRNGQTVYTPIPRDRDQAFYSHNGVLLDFVLYLGGYRYMQDFGYTARDIRFLNVEEADLDRFFANEMGLADWINAAEQLQGSLTDTVIAASVGQLAPAVFAVSGHELIEKLKSRRRQLVDLAREYYLFIAREVEVVGSQEREYFEVKREASGETSVSVYRVSKDSQQETIPYYTRTFHPAETREVRIYGIDGEDRYSVSGQSAAITVRIIGGPVKDSVQQSGSKVHIYDDKNNVLQTQSAKLHLSTRGSIHSYQYESYHYDSTGFLPALLGVSYGYKKYKWRRAPFANEHLITLKYSLPDHVFVGSYAVTYPGVVRHWDLFLEANWEIVRTSFYGLGNETVSTEKNVEYYRIRSRETSALTGLRRVFGKSRVELSAYYDRVSLTNDTGRYTAKVFQPSHPGVFLRNQYAGVRATYDYVSVDDRIVPTKGFAVFGSADHTHNFTRRESFQKYAAVLQGWIALSHQFSLSLKAGGATVAGPSSVLDNAQVSQHAVIGGPGSLRGYRTERFWGRSSFYNTNELRFITNIRTHLLNAKAGLVAFFDEGRVWMPGENSNLMHTSYGAGILLVPFHLLSATLTYGISPEARLIQVSVNALF